MKKEIKEAIEFAQSLRGVYIISQALHYGIKELEKVKSPHKEFSNIEDMKFLKKNLFSLYIDFDKKLLKKLGKKNGKSTNDDAIKTRNTT